jgi:hypothetical protein
VLLPPSVTGPQDQALIRGDATDVNGDPVPGGRANLFESAGNGQRGAFLGRDDLDDGEFVYPVTPGCYVVVLVAPAGRTWDRTGSQFDQSATLCVVADAQVDYDGVIS